MVERTSKGMRRIGRWGRRRKGRLWIELVIFGDCSHWSQKSVGTVEEEEEEVIEQEEEEEEQEEQE